MRNSNVKIGKRNKRNVRISPMNVERSIKNREFETLEKLCRNAFNLKYTLPNGHNPLRFAADLGWENGVQLLLKSINAETKVVKRELSRIVLAVSSKPNVSAILKMLVEHNANVNGRSAMGNTPLIEAAAHGLLQNCATLIELGANVNLKNAMGESALSFGVAWKNVSVIKLLIKHAANVNSSDMNGATPLMIAANHGMTRIVKLLVLAGAKVRSKDLCGNNVIQHAIWSKNENLVKYLRECEKNG